tara:strand:- start:13097 stop:13810 length:714 start_codon:yes stop_codon:yes gene_type:complete
MPYNETTLTWADTQLELLLEKMNNECLICDLVSSGKNDILEYIYEGKQDEEQKDKYKKFRKEFRKNNPESKLTPSKINTRLGQISNLNVIYRTIYLSEEATEDEKQKAKQNIIVLQRVKNLYYANIQNGYISNLNMNARLSSDYLEIILFAFVPASFITGYFGMNFVSMGNPGPKRNKDGLLATRYGHWYAIFIIFSLIMFSYVIVTNSFFSKDIKLSNSIKRLHSMYNLPHLDDNF